MPNLAWTSSFSYNNFCNLIGQYRTSNPDSLSRTTKCLRQAFRKTVVISLFVASFILSNGIYAI